MPGSITRKESARPIGSSAVSIRYQWSRLTSLMQFAGTPFRLIAGTLMFLLLGPVQSQAQNPIVTENMLPGNPKTEWDVSGAGNLSIQGFATDMSVNKGSTVRFKINVDGAVNYRIRIYRLGYYNGMGARLITDLGIFPGIDQPSPLSNNATGLVDCGNWAESASWAVPATAVSGVYIARLIRSDNNGASHIVFVVRDDSRNANLLFKTSDATWQAYNAYGGNSLYVGSVSGYPQGHATKVSYNRPFITRNGGGGGGAMEDWLFNAEYPMIRWMERNGYDVSYTTDVDMSRDATPITPAKHKVLLSVGHDEYWSASARTRFENARNQGVHLAFFSGNEVYWKTRWENSIDGSGTPYRTLVCYKEGTLGENVCGGKCDPQSSTWTGLWRDGCNYPNADGCDPENSLTGQISWVDATGAIRVPAAYKDLPFWRNTSIANLSGSQSVTLPNGTLGYEWDARLSNYSSSYPSGRQALSNTSLAGAVHELSLYTHPSGAKVFGAGTVQWSWGLDNVHDRGSIAPSRDMQQATVNLFFDMGVLAGSLQADLIQGNSSSDTQPPISVISSPANGASLAAGTPVTISGTASDAGGGTVSGVDVSTDNGVSWQRATGTTNWTYSWTPAFNGSYTIKSRSLDNSGNIEIAGTAPAANAITVSVTGSSQTGPFSIWTASSVPGTITDSDNTGIEVGVKFRTSANGFITGIRFYKSLTNTGTHEGTLWSASGTNLGRATFINESASGWQQVLFSTPVAVTAGTTYIASYHTNTGHYSNDENYFTASFGSTPFVQALADGLDGPNGVYSYSGSPTFPTSSFNGSNYWVDVLFTTSPQTDDIPPTVTVTGPANGATGVATTTAITATFNESIDAASVSTASFELRNPAGTLIAATVGYNSTTRTATLTPSLPLANAMTYTATLKGGSTDPRIKDAAGNALVANHTWSFTTGAAAALAVSSTTPASNATGVLTSASISATFSQAIDPATLTSTTFELRNASNTVIAGTLSYNSSTKTATLTPAAALTSSTVYTATLRGGTTDPRIKTADGNTLTANYAWSFTTAAASSGNTFSIFSPTSVPSTTDGETRAVEVGVKFRTTVSGFITGIRYYKATANTGTHVGSLWSRTGTLLARATFVAESGSGWQEVLFSTPVAVNAATTYVASYHTNVGRYSVNANYFTANTTGTVYALRNGLDGNNGVYRYSANSIFPNSSFRSSNYWVDVVFSTGASDVTAPIVTANSPLNGASGVSTATTVTATFNEPVDAATLNNAFELRNSAGTLIPGTVNYNATSRVVTFTPAAALSNSTIYTATLKGGAADPRVKDVAGNALAANYVWSFTTVAATPLTVTSNTPANNATGVSTTATVTATFNQALDQATLNSSSTFELRDAASNLVAGSITYNTTTRTATLSPSAPLANSTVYTVTIRGGTTDPRVKATTGATLAANHTWSFTTAAATPLTITANTPANNATGIATTATVTATFSQAIDQATLNNTTFELRDAANTLVPANILYNTTTRVATLTPSAALANSTVYTATIKGGATDPRVRTAGGVALAANHTWSFTTVAATPLTITANTPANNATGIATTATVTATFSQAIDQATLTDNTFELRDAANTLVPANILYNTTTRVATLTPSAALANSTVYTATIKGGATDPRVKTAGGVALAANHTWSFTTVAATPPGTTYSIWTPSTSPSTITNSDPSAVELGVKFRPLANGFITGIRYYKGPSNTGIHTANLWTTGGANLARATFINETASGWQQVLFATPVAVTANTTYVASYHTTSGNYSSSVNYFGSSVTSGPLMALANGTEGGNGVYRYSPSTVFPNSSFNSSNYWVDVVFITEVAPDQTAPLVTANTPSAGATGISTSTTITATFNEAMDATTLSNSTFELRDASGTLIPANVLYNSGNRTVTLTPSAALNNSTVYTATFRGGTTEPRVKDVAGNALASNFTWNFTTVAATPLTVTANTPANNATGVPTNSTITATFNQAIDEATLTSTTFELRDANNALVAGAIVYNSTTRTATLTPGTGFANSTVYTATIKGGATDPRVKTPGGVGLTSDHTWNFTTAAATPFTVTANAPASGATGVATTATVSVTFSQAIDQGTLNNSTFELRNAANTLIAGLITYNSTTRVATLTPSAALPNSTVYTATIKGGATEPRLKTAGGIALASDHTWSFTTIAAPSADGPYSIFQPNSSPAIIANNDDESVELGVKFRASTSGFITGIRFYKSTSNTGTHVGNLWNRNGTNLARATFINETASGWQQVLFSTPVPITANTTYIASYHAPNGGYSSSTSYFTSGVQSGPLTALANGTDGSNGIYRYTPSTAFPSSAFGSTNYWVDVVFTTETGPDETPPLVNVISPVNGATGVSTSSPVSAIFNEAMDGSTVNSSTFQLTDPNNTVIPGIVNYNPSNWTMTFVPSAPLANTTVYRATLQGGSTDPRVKDLAGNALASDRTWTFTTGAPPPPSPGDGPGGPILVVSTSSNPFSRYTVEILRAEGLNEFTAMDISAVTSAVLNSYDVVILGEVPLTTNQVNMFTDWTNAGGTFIAFRPDVKLAPLLGVTRTSGSISDQYLLVNTANGWDPLESTCRHASLSIL